MRDLRDPVMLGASMLDPKIRALSSGPLSDLYDELFDELGRIPDYNGSNDIRPRVESGAEH